MNYKNISKIEVCIIEKSDEWQFRIFDRDGIMTGREFYESDIYDYVKYLYDFFQLDQTTIQLCGYYSIISFLKWEYMIEIVEI